MDTLLALLCQCAVLAKCLKPVCITAGGCKGACLGAIRDNEYSVETTPGKILGEPPTVFEILDLEDGGGDGKERRNSAARGKEGGSGRRLSESGKAQSIEC
eukprot:1144270-Pelagomonas_calceolata.AAC.18